MNNPFTAFYSTDDGTLPPEAIQHLKDHPELEPFVVKAGGFLETVEGLATMILALAAAQKVPVFKVFKAFVNSDAAKNTTKAVMQWGRVDPREKHAAMKAAAILFGGVAMQLLEKDIENARADGKFEEPGDYIEDPEYKYSMMGALSALDSHYPDKYTGECRCLCCAAMWFALKMKVRDDPNPVDEIVAIWCKE